MAIVFSKYVMKESYIKLWVSGIGDSIGHSCGSHSVIYVGSSIKFKVASVYTITLNVVYT